MEPNLMPLMKTSVEDTLKTSLTLLEKVKDGRDERSWRRFFEKYQGFLLRFIKGRGVPEHDAKDILQNVLVKSFDKLQDFAYDATKGLFRNWLATMACHETVDFYRKLKTDGLVGVQDGDAAVNYLESVAELSPAEIELIAEEEWKAFVLNLAMERLEKNLGGEVVATFEMLRAGKSPKEIAQLLGVDDSTVYRHKSKAEKELIAVFRRIKTEYPLL